MFRRSGSVACFLVEGSVPAPHTAEFRAALAGQRFRSIEHAASEDSSFGWVTPGDPTGDSFEVEDFDFEAGIWLRVRFDRKQLPRAWVAIHRAAAERSRGRPLTVRERRELKEGLLEELLPKVLPSVKLIDVVWLPQRRQALLLATGKGVQEEFAKLFHRTFAATLLPADPRPLAHSLGLEREELAYLDQVTPVAWPSAGPRRAPAAEDEHARAAEGVA